MVAFVDYHMAVLGNEVTDLPLALQALDYRNVYFTGPRRLTTSDLPNGRRGHI